MRPNRRFGFTLVELLVVIAIIGTLVALLLPAVQAARGASRNNTCKNNQKQLALALVNYDSTHSKLPGYINALVQPNNRTIGRRASWVVMTFPYMEEQALWEQWSQQFDQIPSALSIDGLICPSDPAETPGQPWLSYVANAGWAHSDPHRSSPPTAIQPAEPGQEYAGDGAFFDNSVNAAILVHAPGNLDLRDNDPKHYPMLTSSISYIQSNDGTTKTLMLSENIHAWYWAYDSDPLTPGYEFGALPDKDNSPIEDVKHIFGFVWSNSGARIERINGDNDFDAISPILPPATMLHYAAIGQFPGPHDAVSSTWESYGFPSSRHAGGVNAAFCDGHIVTISDQIDMRVYAMLMSSNRKKSKLLGQGYRRSRQKAA
jgi:prepilin-type N-terminal cleavage/methylation domain-containing protein/prepilin-type processing-associated H-X9-DG protein